MAARRKAAPKTTEAAQTTASPTRTVVKEGAPGFFASVESNIKGGVKPVPLSACTAIVSERNRAGKTAVLDSIRFALTGAHPIGPHAADLMGLTADGSLPRAKLVGNAEAEVVWQGKTPTVIYGGALANLMEAHAKQNMLPLVSMRDLLTLGTTKAREELFRRFGKKVDLKPKGLDEKQLALFNTMLNEATGSDDVERLSEAGTFLRGHKRTLSARIKQLEEERNMLAGRDPVTDDVVRDLQSRLDKVTKYKQAEQLRKAVEQVRDGLMSYALAWEQRRPSLTPEQLQAAKEENCLPYPVDEKVPLEKRKELEAVKSNARLYSLLHHLRQQLHTGCLVCARPFDGEKGHLLDSVQSALDSAMAEVKALEKGVEEAERTLAMNKAERLQVIIRLDNENNYRIAEEQRILALIKERKAEYERLLKLAEDAGGVEAPSDDEASLRAQLDEVAKAKAAADRASNIASELRQLKMEQEDTKSVESALSAMLDLLLGSVQADAEAAVNRWMPPGFKAQLTLEDTEGKPTCRWAVIGSDGRAHPRAAASGAEWAALTVAVACAWTEGLPYRFLLLDDADVAGFNAENIKQMLTMVAKAVEEGKLTQAFVAWSRPAEIPDNGWSVVAL